MARNFAPADWKLHPISAFAPHDTTRGGSILWILPRVALMLFFVALGTLLWYLHRSELEEQRATLITDVLWAEQDLRFALSQVEQTASDLGREIAAGLNIPDLESRLRHHVTQTPWLLQIAILDGDGRTRDAYPSGMGAMVTGEATPTVPSPPTRQLATSLGRPAYSPPYRAVGNDTHVEIHAPMPNGQGVVVAIVSLGKMVEKEIPWWFAERYTVTIDDAEGAVLAKKSSVAAPDSELAYQVPLDPPGHGLILRVVAHKTDTGLTRHVLGAIIVALALAVLWSLWALRRHVQHRYAAEAALRNEHAFRMAMEDSLFTGLRARDMDGRITYVNPAFCRMTGFSADELIGCAPPMPYWAPEEVEQTQKVHDRILAGDIPREGAEVRLMRKNGERFDALVYEAPLIDAGGRQTGWMGSVLDITERKRAEELARQQQEKLQFTARLVTMGEMASTLAHELNQPLAAIASYNTGCLNRLEAGHADRDELMPVLRKVATQAQRAGAIIRRVHEFVRRSEPKRIACDLREVIEDSIDLVEADARKRGVRIQCMMPARAMPVTADRVMIEQVLLNLIRNGMDAMGDASPEDKELAVSVTAADQTFVVSVIDRGCGIPATVAERLYSPFFTTKVEGMGMGLNICRSIMELHEGRLWFEPNPEGGTIFRFSLPEERA